VNSPASKQVDADRLQQASDWVQRLAGSADVERTFVEWQQWCDADPGNIRLFAQMQEVWDGFAPARVARVAHGATARRQLKLWALAASLVLIISGALWFGSSLFAVQRLQTNIGEVRHQILSDGSRVHLSADSKLTIRYTDQLRDLRLEAGRAYFDVARDPMRPFVVHAGGLSVTAVGTQFDVRTGPDDITVIVGEGRVKISEEGGIGRLNAEEGAQPLHVNAGQRVTYSKPAGSLRMSRVDPQLAISWRQGALQFQEEPLEEVVREVNRYTARKIVLHDQQVARVPFTGTISPERVDDWLIALEEILPVTVERRFADKVDIVRRRSQPAGK
jgi:transmembrane sensor